MSQPPGDRPLFIFDGDCAFCRMWVDYWRRLTGDSVAYEPYQQAAQRFPDIAVEEFESSARLVLPDGHVRSGAHAVFGALSYAPGRAWPLWLYEHLWGFRPAAELAYRLVAANRSLLYRPTRLLLGSRLEPPTYALVKSLFLRVLGVIYLIAFLSFWTQQGGLIGSGGILPVGAFLDAVHGSLGTEAYWRVPTLFWIDSADRALTAVATAGAAVSVMLIAGILQRTSLILLYVLYPSIKSGGQLFTFYQWDALLLEVSFLAIFLTLPGSAVVWLFRALLFRFMFLAGAAKLLSGDPTWRDLTALNFHYQTQPLPTWIGWYAHQLPEWAGRLSVAGMFFVELFVPFLVFFPRRIRFFAAACLGGLNVLILLTGNYNFFNLLAIAMCLLLLDDSVVGRWLPGRLVGYLTPGKAASRWASAIHGVVAVLAVFVLVMGALQIATVFKGHPPGGVDRFMGWVEPYDLVNGYGLFAAMTTERPEIVVQGSRDGIIWADYEFAYKPGDLHRRPGWAAPHQPRLDWQMWFAALGTFEQSPWLVNLMVRLLQGSPEVTGLFAHNPFPETPPRFVCAELYVYEFTDYDNRRSTGAWWKREYRGPYLPPISLRGG